MNTDPLKSAMQSAGIEPPPEVVTDGGLHRFHIEGDRPRTTNGWYVAFDDPPAGAFGCWKRGISETFSDPGRTLDPEAKARHRANLEAARQAREAEQARIQAEARKKAASIWNASEPATATHPYLKKKGVQPYGIRTSRGALVVPVRQGDSLTGLQFIDADGNKKFLTGTAKRGGYFAIGGRPENVLYLAEGYATGATIHEATEQPVAVCFDAGNLRPVAESMREKFPGVRIVVCADNDESGTGQQAAQDAAQAINGEVVIPPMQGDFNDMATAQGLDSVREAIEPVKTPSRRFFFAPVSEIISENMTPAWGVKGIFEQGSTVSVIGKSGDGKTFFVIDIALTIAAGLDAWHGHAVEVSGPVLYVCGEGRGGIGRRVEAWLNHHGIENDVPFFISSGPAQLLDPGSLKDVEQAALEIEQAHGRPAFIIIDTLNRNFGPGDENSTSDMTQFIAALDRLRINLGCAVAVVHHTGHQAAERGRGNSSLFGALDFEYRVFREGEAVHVECTKSKDYERPAPKAFECVTVTLRHDQDGDPITSMVLGPTKHQARNPRKLPPSQRIALDALKHLIENERQGVHLEDWRTEAYSRGIADTPDAKRQAFNRARIALLSAGHVQTRDDIYWLSGHSVTCVTQRDNVTGCHGVDSVTSVTLPLRGVTSVTHEPTAERETPAGDEIPVFDF